jgi:regulator of replication initiation timing
VDKDKKDEPNPDDPNDVKIVKKTVGELAPEEIDAAAEIEAQKKEDIECLRQEISELKKSLTENPESKSLKAELEALRQELKNLKASISEKSTAADPAPKGGKPEAPEDNSPEPEPKEDPETPEDQEAPTKKPAPKAKRKAAEPDPPRRHWI